MGKSAAEFGEILRGLTGAWNSGDSTAFAAHFAEDGDVVNIYGMRLQGRKAIAGLYDMLFRSVFRRSRIDAEVTAARSLCSQAMALQLRIALHAPSGSMKGDHDAVSSLVLQRHGKGWQVASLHNTLVAEGAERILVA